MEKENIIISIIIVLCIAAAVAAYGITNSDGPIFSDLSSMSASDSGLGTGLGNSTAVHNGTGSSASTATTDGGSGSGSGSGDSGSGSSDSGSGNGGGSSDSGSGNNGGNSQSTVLSYSEAQSIADSAVGEPGCYAGSVSYSDGFWYATIYDENGTAVDSIGVEDATGMVSRM